MEQHRKLSSVAIIMASEYICKYICLYDMHFGLYGKDLRDTERLTKLSTVCLVE